MIESLAHNEHIQNQVSLKKDFNYNDIEFLATQTIAQDSDGIGIIVKLAQSGKIDPWNIDIVDLTDKYLANLFEMKTQNLRMTGRTFLYAAILIRLKSNILKGIDTNSFEAEELEDFDDDYDTPDYQEEPINRNNVVSLDEVLQRRSSIRLNRKRVVTLDDLIKQLAFYEELDKKRSLKNAHERAKRRVQSYANFSVDDIISAANEEFIEKNVEKLQKTLIKIFDTKEKIELKEQKFDALSTNHVHE